VFENLDSPYCTVNKSLGFSCLPTECLMYRRNVKLFFMERKQLLRPVSFFYCIILYLDVNILCWRTNNFVYLIKIIDIKLMWRAGSFKVVSVFI
jgi:hypothetical protein